MIGLFLATLALLGLNVWLYFYNTKLLKECKELLREDRAYFNAIMEHDHK